MFFIYGLGSFGLLAFCFCYFYNLCDQGTGEGRAGIYEASHHRVGVPADYSLRNRLPYFIFMSVEKVIQVVAFIISITFFLII